MARFRIRCRWKKIEIAEISKIADNGWASVLVNNGIKSISVWQGDVNNHNLKVGDKIKFTVKKSAQAQNITKLYNPAITLHTSIIHLGYNH